MATTKNEAQLTTMQKVMFAPKKGQHAWEKEEYLDVIYWGGSALGMIMGLLWGYFGIVGAFGLAAYLIGSTVIAIMYTASYQDLDLEEFDGVMGIAKEGFMNRFASFLVSWILMHTYMQ